MLVDTVLCHAGASDGVEDVGCGVAAEYLIWSS